MPGEDDGGLSVFAAAQEHPGRIALLAPGAVLSWSAVAERVGARLEELHATVAPRSAGRMACATSPASEDMATAQVRVALRGDRSLEAIIWALALLERAEPFVLLHPRWTLREQRSAMAAAGVLWLVGEAGIERVGSSSPNAQESPGAASSHDALTPHPWACVVFTSGSSGKPRGAVLSRSALQAAARASEENLGWRPDDRWLLNLPLGHVGGLSVLTRTLIARRTVVLDDSQGFDVARFLGQVARDRVTLASIVPTMLQRILEAGGGAVHSGPPGPPESLRAVLVGGARAEPSLVARARDRGWPILLTYGMTETSAQIATQRADRLGHQLADDAVGSPLRGSEVEIRSLAQAAVPSAGVEERVEMAGPGELGQVVVRGPSLFEGYLGTPRERTFDTHGWFETGDFARWTQSGEMQIVDRRSDLIVTGGENVYPSEVEAALLELEAVRAACVVPLPDAEWGHRVGCAVVLTRPVDPSATTSNEAQWRSLQEALRQRLAGFKVPSRWIALSALPRIGLGKVDRQAVQKLLAAGAAYPFRGEGH